MIGKCYIMITVLFCLIIDLTNSIDMSRFTDPSTLSPEHQEHLNKEYEKFMKQRQKDKQAKEEEELRKQQQSMPPPPKGISPMELGLKRMSNDPILLTVQANLPGGKYYFGTQMSVGDKLVPAKGGLKDGAEIRKAVTVKPFSVDVDCVTNEQFKAFVDATNYKTEAELYSWSFVLANQVSDAVKAEVDSESGFGRVKNAPHWMAVMHASWAHPYGLDSSIDSILQLPVVHVSYKDASEYCAWAGRRLLNEHEWEYAARGGRVNENYPWGNAFKPHNLNIWGGDGFPETNDMVDGFLGPAPVNEASTFPPNDFGLYNMVGNVWEWVKGGKASARILRGGSFVDSKDGQFNHAVRVSTRQLNAGDSAATNIGFRCGGPAVNSNSKSTSTTTKKENNAIHDVEAEHIEL